MIEYCGQQYEVHSMPHNKFVKGYLKDGVFKHKKPLTAKCLGYIQDGDGVIEIYKSRMLLIRLLVCAAIIGLCFFHWQVSRVTTIEYKTSFAEFPVYEEGVLYCSVVNVSDIEVTVTFQDDFGNKSITTSLRPGDTIPYLELDFVPTQIVYDNQYSFKLEAQYD